MFDQGAGDATAAVFVAYHLMLQIATPAIMSGRDAANQLAVSLGDE
jgi:hypothetical protein